jgi:hypothetical protein
MTSDQRRLREITSKIIDARRPFWSLGEETGALQDLLGEHATFQMDLGGDITEGESRSGSGLAISPTQAAMCAMEVARTAAFIRGLEQAIRDVRTAAGDRPVRILYAGCGPYALLAIPQMSLFPPDQVQFVLLDIHETSLGSARNIVESLGFTGYIASYVCADACRYKIPDDAQPDIIVSETMNVCLWNEPLVTIACHLLSQSETAILLPSNVRIDACLVDDSKEFRLLEKDELPGNLMPERDRVMLGKIFELNAENARRWGSPPGDRLPASRIKIPSPLENRYRPKLFTTVTVYGTTILKDYDTSLTIPTPIPVDQPLQGGEVLQFEYRLGAAPWLGCEVVSEDENTSGG